MPKKPEGALYQRIKQNLPGCFITRIESRVNLGIPDCLIALKDPAKFVMLELKVVSKGRKVNLSPHQVAFHLKHAELGCPTFVLVQYHPPGATTAAKAQLLFYRGCDVMELFLHGIDLEPLAKWPVSGMKWEELREGLVGRFD